MLASARLDALANDVVHKAKSVGAMVATAESCTGGMIGAAMTDVPGSSAGFDRGFITYSNAAKTELLGVSSALIAVHGAVSGEVARAMAKGALDRSAASIAVSVTGIAGPDGGSVDKPVGLVWFGLATRHSVRTERRVFAGGGRGLVRLRAAETALTLVLAALASA